MTTAEAPPKAKQEDIWRFYQWEYAEELPCLSLRRFVMYLDSPSTRRADAASNVARGIADVTLYGPITDEAIYNNQGEGEAHIVRFQLSRDIVFQELDPEGRRALVDKLRDRGIRGQKLQLLCNALRLPRVA